MNKGETTNAQIDNGGDQTESTLPRRVHASSRPKVHLERGVTDGRGKLALPFSLLNDFHGGIGVRLRNRNANNVCD